MTTVDYLLKRFGMRGHKTQMPIEVPNVGRADLATIFFELGFKRGVEVGVMEGEFSEVLCRKNPELHLHAVDLWQAREEYVDEPFKQEVFDRWESTARKRLAPYNCTIHKTSSLEAVELFEDRSLDFVYLDADHGFVPLTLDLNAWTPKVKVGGILAGHDYAKMRPRRAGLRVQGAPGHRVVQVVNAWTEAYAISPWFVLGAKEIAPNQVRDKWRSWAWVVE